MKLKYNFDPCYFLYVQNKTHDFMARNLQLCQGANPYRG